MRKRQLSVSTTSSVRLLFIFSILAVQIFLCLTVLRMEHAEPVQNAEQLQNEEPLEKSEQVSTMNDIKKTEVERSMHSGEPITKPKRMIAEEEAMLSKFMEEEQLDDQSKIEGRMSQSEGEKPQGTYYVYLNIKASDDEPDKPFLQKVLEEEYELLTERVSDEDIQICLDEVISTGTVHERPAWLVEFMAIMVEREAGGEPLLGKILVAEELIRRTGGLYGDDYNAIFINGYKARLESDGKLHVYNGDKEITTASEDSKKALDIALNGSDIGGEILKVITLRKTELGIDCLDKEFYSRGIIYHHSPDTADKGEISARHSGRVPVRFQFGNHEFYGKWLNKQQTIDYR